MITMKGAAIAAAMLLTSTQAMAANQFDLVCKGTQQLKTGAPETEWKDTFRFDLDQKRWCRGACKTAAAIDSITTDEIVVSNSRASTGSRIEAGLTFRRATGEVREYVDAGWAGSSFDLASGKCTKDLYSGMPDNKF
jgi:hypothetical protein